MEYPALTPVLFRMVRFVLFRLFNIISHIRHFLHGPKHARWRIPHITHLPVLSIVNVPTPGETQAYTIGDIGGHRCVVTKLPMTGHSREDRRVKEKERSGESRGRWEAKAVAERERADKGKMKKYEIQSHSVAGNASDFSPPQTLPVFVNIPVNTSVPGSQVVAEICHSRIEQKCTWEAHPTLPL